MAPSATQVQELVQPIVQKTLDTRPEPEAETAKPSNGTGNGAVSATPSKDELPKLLTGHKEPLKLHGALDQFTSFDVTPVIGREFPNADLAKWLRAPNSDELLRDLAITSAYYLPTS